MRPQPKLRYPGKPLGLFDGMGIYLLQRNKQYLGLDSDESVVSLFWTCCVTGRVGTSLALYYLGICIRSRTYPAGCLLSQGRPGE